MISLALHFPSILFAFICFVFSKTGDSLGCSGTIFVDQATLELTEIYLSLLPGC